MQTLSRGQKLKLADLTTETQLTLAVRADFPPGITADLSCFGVDAADQLKDDRYFVFYNQKSSPEGALQSHGGDGQAQERFAVALSRLPDTVRKLVFTLTIDGEGTVKHLRDGFFRVQAGGQTLAEFPFRGSDFGEEKALIIGEVYFKDVWRIAAVGQGFNGGLSALLKHFGGSESAAPAPAPAPAAPPKIDLVKRVEEKAPALVSLVKQAQVSLKKVGLDSHRAKVALCLDISGSMYKLYGDGQVQKFAERILALGCNFDDDGAIDVFLFGEYAHDVGPMSLDNFPGLIDRLLKQHPLEGGTAYGKAIEKVRQFYFPEVPTRMSNQQLDRKTPTSADLPVYVMFVTDGTTDDKAFSERQIRMASYEPIFWQFMTIGRARFDFLEKLDTLSDRYIDNAGFFNVMEPKDLSDEKLYSLLMKEYPQWIPQAKSKGLLR